MGTLIYELPPVFSREPYASLSLQFTEAWFNIVVLDVSLSEINDELSAMYRANDETLDNGATTAAAATLTIASLLAIGCV